MQKILREGEEEEIQKIKIEDLVMDSLQSHNRSLCLLPEFEMAKVSYNSILDFENVYSHLRECI